MQFVRELRQPEICELGIAVFRDQDVLWLDVAMQNARVVSRHERVGDAGEQFHDVASGTSAGPRPVAQRSTLDKFDDEIRSALELTGDVDIRMCG